MSRVVQGRNSTLLVTGRGAGIGWASVVLVPLATIMLFPWTWENLFVEVSLASDGGRVQRVLSITCFQRQNDIYSAFTPSLSRSDTFPRTHSKSVHWWLCRKCSLYVSPYLVFNQWRGGNNLVPRAFPLKNGLAGKGPGIGWSRVPSYTLKSWV